MKPTCIKYKNIFYQHGNAKPKVKKFKCNPSTPQYKKARKHRKNISYKIIGRLTGKKIVITLKLGDTLLRKTKYEFEKIFNPIYQDNVIYVKRIIPYTGEKFISIEMLNQECKKVLDELSQLTASEESRNLLRHLNQNSAFFPES